MQGVRLLVVIVQSGVSSGESSGSVPRLPAGTEVVQCATDAFAPVSRRMGAEREVRTGLADLRGAVRCLVSSRGGSRMMLGHGDLLLCWKSSCFPVGGVRSTSDHCTNSSSCNKSCKAQS